MVTDQRRDRSYSSNDHGNERFNAQAAILIRAVRFSSEFWDRGGTVCATIILEGDANKVDVGSARGR